ncbi:hypothetical protein [Turicibacter bilis]|uniref:hypothetical protein n=1 Tax=Turicibacter bilis TaxID=2735723 RepID=UPI0031B9F02E
MDDELGKILKMIESGVITSEDGQALIKVIDTAHRKVNEVNQGMTGRFLHINVDSHDKEEEVIEINIPLNFARSVLKMGFIQKQIKAQTRTGIELDLDEMIDLLNLDSIGDLITIDRNSANVRIWID